MTVRYFEVPVPSGIAKLAEFFCGCTSSIVWHGLHAELKQIASKICIPHGDDDSPENLAWELTLAMLDKSGCIEHGTSIRSSWLTDEGKEALAFLDKWGPEWHADPPPMTMFLDDEGTVQVIGH